MLTMKAKFERIKNRFPWKSGLIVLALAVLFLWLYFTPEGLLGKADAVGYAVCHRIEARSFHLGVRQVPVCARCTGQYIGAVLGLGYLFIRRPRRVGRPGWGIIGVLVGFAILYGVDGFNSYLHLVPALTRFSIYQPNNILRLLTGTGLGLGISVMIYPAFNDTVWRRRDSRPVLAGWLDFGGLILLGLSADVLILTENLLILYPFAIISALGVLLLLTLVYTMVILMLFKFENKIETIPQLTTSLMAGFMIALLQIAILDYLRFWMTGTWAGFHFG